MTQSESVYTFLSLTRHFCFRMRIIAIATVLALPVAAQAQAPGGQFTPKELIGDSVSDPNAARYSDVAEAIKRFLNRDQLSARTFLERAVEKEPKLPPVGVLLAKMQLLVGNSAAIRPALEQAVQEDSATDPEPYLLLAEEALSNNRTIEADALFDKAVVLIESYSTNAKRKRRFVIRAHRGRAVVAERRENWEQAKSDLEKWLEQDPEDAAALTRMGQVLFMLDNPRAGYETFVKAKKLNDKLPTPYVSAALMYTRQDKMTEARKAFEKAFSENSSDERTLIAYAQALLKEGDTKKVAPILAKARSVSPGSLNVWLLSGVASRMEGNTNEAEANLMRALGLAPSNRDVLNQLSQVLIESTDPAEQQRALQFAQVNGQLNANNPDVNITLAWALYQSGQAGQANAALQKAIRGGALSSDGQYLLARMLLLNNDKTNARRLLEAAIKGEQGIFIQKKAAKKLLGTL